MGTGTYYVTYKKSSKHKKILTAYLTAVSEQAIRTKLKALKHQVITIKRVG